MNPKIAILLLFGLFAAGLSFAGSCPAGADGCFLCGGVNGTPCDQNCNGPYRPGLGYVACECPQGKACTCYCPYEGGEAVTGSGLTGTETGAFAKITAYEGLVYVMAPGGEWAQVTQGVPLGKDYQIKTGTNSKVTILVDDGSKIYMDESTELGMVELERPASKTTFDVVLELVKGAIFSDVTKREVTKFEVGTPTGSTGVKGTKFSVYYNASSQETTVKAVEGSVSVTDMLGNSETLNAGSMVVVTQSGIGQPSAFDTKAELDKWGAGGCLSAMILALVPLFIFASSMRR